MITSVTYKTFPLPTHINTVFAQYTTNSSISRRHVLRNLFRAVPEITDSGYTGYGTLGQPIGIILLQPNATKETATRVTEILKSVGNVTNGEVVAGGLDFLTWMDYSNTFLSDPNVATNVIDPSRLLTPEVLLQKTDDILDVIDDFEDLAPGFNFSEF